MKLKIIMVGLVLVGVSSVTCALTATYQTVCYVTCASHGSEIYDETIKADQMKQVTGKLVFLCDSLGKSKMVCYGEKRCGMVAAEWVRNGLQLSHPHLFQSRPHQHEG